MSGHKCFLALSNGVCHHGISRRESGEEMELSFVIVYVLPIVALLFMPSVFRVVVSKSTRLSVFLVLLVGFLSLLPLAVMLPNAPPAWMMYVPLIVGELSQLGVLAVILWNKGIGPSRRQELGGLAFVFFLLVTSMGVMASLEGIRSGHSMEVRARTASDLRTIALALEAYHTSQGCYPPPIDENGAVIPFDPEYSETKAGYVPRNLIQSPENLEGVATVPSDPASVTKDGGNTSYRYATDGKNGWVLAGNGPDGDVDVDLGALIATRRIPFDQRFVRRENERITGEYDRQNGSPSSGDIIRFSQP
jgi:hypothetical protein